MADWQRTLNLKEVWNNGDGDLHEVSKAIALGLKRMPPIGIEYVDETAKDLAETFEDMSTDEDLTQNDFNYMMQDLYDWADLHVGESPSTIWGKKNCWIKTAF